MASSESCCISGTTPQVCGANGVEGSGILSIFVKYQKVRTGYNPASEKFIFEASFLIMRIPVFMAYFKARTYESSQ